MSMKVSINGKKEHLKDGMSIGALLVEREIRREVVVVELNGNILKREDYDSVLLKDGDSVELVYYMGAGIATDRGQTPCPPERGRRLQTPIELGSIEPSHGDVQLRVTIAQGQG